MADKTIIKPSISSLSPTSGLAGTRCTISGSGFVDGNNIHGIFFGDVPAEEWIVESDGLITGVTAPEGGTSGSVTVRTEGGIDNFGGEPQTSNAASFTYTA